MSIEPKETKHINELPFNITVCDKENKATRYVSGTKKDFLYIV